MVGSGMTTFDLFTWLTAAASILGTVLNIRHDRRCFWIWTGTNAAWTVIDLAYGVWAQAFLQGVYLGLALWGLVAWRAR